ARPGSCLWRISAQRFRRWARIGNDDAVVRNRRPADGDDDRRPVGVPIVGNARAPEGEIARPLQRDLPLGKTEAEPAADEHGERRRDAIHPPPVAPFAPGVDGPFHLDVAGGPRVVPIGDEMSDEPAVALRGGFGIARDNVRASRTRHRPSCPGRTRTTLANSAMAGPSRSPAASSVTSVVPGLPTSPRAITSPVTRGRPPSAWPKMNA